MALTEAPTELYNNLVPESATTIRSIGSSESLHSIRSLGDIPFVESSFDLDLDTIIGGNNSITASYFSTPRYTRTNTANSNLQTLDSPWSSKTSGTFRPEEGSDRGSGDCAHNVPQRTSSRNIEELRIPRDPKSSDADLLLALDNVAKAGGAIASMNDFIDTWAPTAHYVVVAAAALQRDAAAFANALTSLLNTSRLLDPSYFAAQYYQLREAYSSLLSLGDFSTLIYGQQGWTRASAKHSTYRPNDTDIERTWDDRQLVDSFVTLLRTSPGFLASAIMQMADMELQSFCADEDNSALNVLFHGVLNSAQHYRPRVFAELLNCLRNDRDKHCILARSLLSKFAEQAIGKLSPSASTKLERLIQSLLARSEKLPDFELILAACLPSELTLFIESLSEASWSLSQETCHTHISRFIRQLIAFPHQYGILSDVYISEHQRRHLETFATNTSALIEKYIQRCRDRKVYEGQNTAQTWRPDELIALKGSDLLLLYNSLLPPSRGNHGAFGQFSPPSVPIDDEWCLDSIRADLVPVMQGLSHSGSTRSEGWQIFKVGIDGLITDIGSDMGLGASNVDDLHLTPQMAAVCEAIAHHDAPTVQERVEAAREDALLRGDHVSALNLKNADLHIDNRYVEAMQSRVSLLKIKCRTLRDALDQAALAQRRERERLSKLLAILDLSRVQVWYEYEVRVSNAYCRSREFLQALYSGAKDDDDDGLSENSSNGENSGGYLAPSSGSAISRRLSILSSHAVMESPFYSKEIFPKNKLSDKEIDTTVAFMRKHRVRNVIPTEEKFHRALVEIALLSRKLIDRDHIASSVVFKRDRHYQNNYKQQHAPQGTNRNAARKSGSHHRRSSLGLFDFFDTSNYHSGQPKASVTLHTTTSTQFLGLASSHESLKYPNVPSSSRNHEDHHGTSKGDIGPPRSPSLSEIQSIVLSDLARRILSEGTETDAYMRQIGCMLLEGDSQVYQPLLDDISNASSPQAKLEAVNSLVMYAKSVLQSSAPQGVSRADVVHELSKKLGREAGTLYRDLQVISTLMNPAQLDISESFDDCLSAARIVLDTVVKRSMDYATRFMRYYMEATTSSSSKMAIMGINDSISIWEFCAKQGNPESQLKLAELYTKFPHLALDVRPLSRPGSVVDGVDSAGVRDAVALHWMALASRL